MSRQRQGYRHPFVIGVHYLGGVGDPPRTLADLAMSQLSAQLRRRDRWWDPGTREQWEGDLSQFETLTVRTPSKDVSVKLTDKQIRYVLDELDGYAKLRDDENWSVCLTEMLPCSFHIHP